MLRWNARLRPAPPSWRRPAPATTRCDGTCSRCSTRRRRRDFSTQPALQIAAGLVTAASLAPLTGQQLGVYRITALLGRGGMGEVYRARDTRLGREVAIKVLPRALTGNPDRLARLEREARVLASLNHTHIGMLHGLEESDGHLALILELVEGETLAERLARGPVAVKPALNWARQIAEALDAAHDKGIVHRDLKPANVKITPQDVVKVLDFGLARTFEVAQTSTSRRRSLTITIEGAAIVGTAAYMSPEQARGQAVDKRADVWAFGCVLYELLTGRMAFAGATVPDTLTAVLQGEPDWTALPAGVPPAVTTLLRRCLEKDVRQRRRDIGDVRAELVDALSQPGSAAPPASDAAFDVATVPAARRRRRRDRCGRTRGLGGPVVQAGGVGSARAPDHGPRRHGGNAGRLARRQGRRVCGAGRRPPADLAAPTRRRPRAPNHSGCRRS